MFAAYNAMLKSGSSKAYRATFTKGCEPCEEDAQTIESVFAKRNTIENGFYSVDKLTITGRFSHSMLITVQGVVSAEAATVRHGSRTVDHFSGFSSMPVGWSVSEVRGRWLVTRGTVLR
jgi:hypothetical protein